MAEVSVAIIYINDGEGGEEIHVCDGWAAPVACRHLNSAMRVVPLPGTKTQH